MTMTLHALYIFTTICYPLKKVFQPYSQFLRTDMESLNAQVDKIQENRSQSVGDNLPKLAVINETPFFGSNRPEAIAQGKIQEAINNSPKIRQARMYQKMAHNTPKAKQLRAYQLMANTYVFQKKDLNKSTDQALNGGSVLDREKQNKTGLAVPLKSDVENPSGYLIDNTKEHHHAEKPFQLQSPPYTQEKNVRPGSERERRIQNEAWHVVQKKQGKGKSAMQMKSKRNANDIAGLEKKNEAAVMDEKALLNFKTDSIPKKGISGPLNEMGGYPVQRKVTIKGKRTQTYANLRKFEASGLYRDLMAAFAGYRPDIVRFHLSQLFSTDDVEFENIQHFKDALEYDIQNKSLPDGEHTLQEQYMTLYGWNRRAAAKSAASAPSAIAEASSPPQLKVYRTMDVVDYEAIQSDPSKLSGHLGDFKQAQNYLHRKSDKPKVLVEFTLVPGAERRLFGPGVMAFPAARHKRRVPNLIRDTLIKEGARDDFGAANQNEGTAPDKVGIKSENGEAGFSLGIGGGTSPVLFMEMVEKMEIIGRSHPEEESKAPSAPASANPLNRAETGGNKAPSSASAFHLGRSDSIVDEAVIDGRRYKVITADVRSTGECFWDTLRHYGIMEDQIRAAANASGLTVDTHVNADQIGTFFDKLSEETGRSYRVSLDIINMLDLTPMESRIIGRGDTVINIGFFLDPNNSQGHYVPQS